MEYNQIDNNQEPVMDDLYVGNEGENISHKKNDFNIGKVVVITFIVAAIFGALVMFISMKIYGGTVTNITKTEKEVTVTDSGIADAVDKIHDSVVIIKTYVKDQLYATGTGFIYKKENGKYYFISNYHVIENGDQIRVQFADESEAVVKIEEGDKYADIVVLSLESKKDYPVAEMGSSINARVGDTVFALGSPLDYSVYSYSVTRGIISGKNREVAVSVGGSMNDWIMQVIQTDAAINEGNSGGPLCNINGEVIGVTNMKLASAKIEGMGFAIPIEEAANYADAVINGQDMSRPYLGVTMTNANTAVAVTRYGIEMQDGVVVEDIEKGSPSEEAGLQKGDIIKKMDDVVIKDVAALRYQLFKYKVGDKITIEYIRNGNTNVTELVLSARK